MVSGGETKGRQLTAGGAGRESARVAYVLKVYPRYSETFIVSEILAHEEAGLDLEIFALRPPTDTHFQDIISRVRSRVTYIPNHTPDAPVFWDALVTAGAELPGFWDSLSQWRSEPVKNVFQAVVLARLLKAKGITHVHAHFASLPTTIARMAGRFAGIPYTFTAHAKDLFHESVDANDLACKLRDACSAITVSDYNVRFLRDAHGTAATKVRRIYNGLDLDRFPYSSPGNRAGDIVAVGRLVEKKGFHDLIAACALLRERGALSRCSIIGAGPLETALKERISNLGLDDTVELLGPLPQNEVVKRIRNARVFAAPCVDASDGNREGLPTVLIEAMALGTPCVANDVTGVSELVRHDDTGLLTSQHDIPALATAIGRLLVDESLCARLAQNGRLLVEERFDIRRNAAQLRVLFEPERSTRVEAA